MGTSTGVQQSFFSRPWVRGVLIVLAVAALAVVAVYAPSCQSKRPSALTGEMVPLEQAYEDLDRKREIDEAASQRDAAKAAAAEALDRENERAAVEKASKEAERRTAKDRRDFERFAQAAREDADARIRAIEQEARRAITDKSDALEDARTLSDEQLAATIAAIRKETKDLIDARSEATEDKIRARGEAIAAEKAAIDAQARADANKWAWVGSAFAVVRPLLAALPGGAPAGDGINSLLLLAGAGGGLAALKKRSEAAKSQAERDEYAALAEDAERKYVENEAKLKKSLAAVVSITDSIEQMKDKLPDGVWDLVKNDVRGWQGPQAEALVTAARNHIDPAKVL